MKHIVNYNMILQNNALVLELHDERNVLTISSLESEIQVLLNN